MEEFLCLSFFVLLSVTNLKELLMSVQEVFWLLRQKLQNHFCNTKEVVENTNFWKKTILSIEKKISLFSFRVSEY